MHAHRHTHMHKHSHHTCTQRFAHLRKRAHTHIHTHTNACTHTLAFTYTHPSCSGPGSGTSGCRRWLSACPKRTAAPWTRLHAHKQCAHLLFVERSCFFNDCFGLSLPTVWVCAHVLRSSPAHTLPQHSAHTLPQHSAHTLPQRQHPWRVLPSHLSITAALVPRLLSAPQTQRPYRSCACKVMALTSLMPSRPHLHTS